MSNVTAPSNRIAAMSESSVQRVRALEAVVGSLPQTELSTRHLIHAGMYARTITIPADMVMTGVFIKIPTTLIVQGDVHMCVDDGVVELNGYNVLPASAGRKQAFITRSEVHMTMLFATGAKTVEQAEAEFTDEVDILVSRRDGSRDTITITGD